MKLIAKIPLRIARDGIGYDVEEVAEGAAFEAEQPLAGALIAENKAEAADELKNAGRAPEDKSLKGAPENKSVKKAPAKKAAKKAPRKKKG